MKTRCSTKSGSNPDSKRVRRGLFRGLKSSELAWQRPYRHVPMPERMNHRLKDWGDGASEKTTKPIRPSLQQEAQQAQELEPITLGQLSGQSQWTRRGINTTPQSGTTTLPGTIAPAVPYHGSPSRIANSTPNAYGGDVAQEPDY